jgi:error-prone DNA polymerase
LEEEPGYRKELLKPFFRHLLLKDLRREDSMDKNELSVAVAEEKYLEVNVKSHIILPFREDLKLHGFITSRQLRYKKTGDRVWVAGRLTLVHTPPTKSGIRVMFITLEDEFGLIDLVFLPEKQSLYAKKLLLNLVCLCRGKVRRLGKGDVSIVVEELMDVKEFYRRIRNSAGYSL